jgi:hypothetical protein
MKGAFAKLMEKNPVQSSHTDFRAGGNGVPILTRASGSSTTGYQTMGLPNGSRPYPGGGANKTALGPYRMGDQDGNAPGSAIYPNDIFGPIGQPGRVYPERTFANVGNNVYQPENDDKATLALLRRLGDQKFKAIADAPFEEYRAQQKLVASLNEAGKNASLADLGVSREIIRNIAAERRQQNEDDYLRRMLDSGATPEAAAKEIENVRNANALQEARKIDDRPYQSKLLIQRMAAARGVTPMIREPLNQSSAIDNPQRSQAMSQAMGMPGEGFGTSPLDANRQFMTPAFYKKFLRRSALTQEAADEQTAFNNLLVGSGDEMIPPPSEGAYSFATMRGEQRQTQIELVAEGLAARLETIRNRTNRVRLPLPNIVVGKDVLKKLYRDKDKKVGDNVLFSLETIQDMRTLQLIMALNMILALNKNSFTTLISELNARSFGTEQLPSPTIIEDLKEIVQLMNKNEPNISIPFASTNIPILNSRLVLILQEIKNNNNNQALRRESEAAHKEYSGLMQRLMSQSIQSEVPAPASTMATAKQAIAEVPIPGAPGNATPYVDAIRRGLAGRLSRNTVTLQAPPKQAIAEVPIPSAPGNATPYVDAIRRGLAGRLSRNTVTLQAPPKEQRVFDMMTNAQLRELLISNGLPANKSESKPKLIAKIKSRPDLFQL